MTGQRPGASGEETGSPGLGHSEPAEPELLGTPLTGRSGRLGRSQLGPEPPAEEGTSAETGAIGEALRRRRADRGLTLSDIERDTRINRSYLEALEAERWDTLPAPVYTRGFLRSYGRHLGLDAEELVAGLPADLPRPAGLEPLPGLRHIGGTPPLEALNARMVLAIVTAIAVVVAAAVLALQLRGGGSDDGDAPLGTPTPTPTAAAASPGDAGTVVGAVVTVPPAEEGTTPDFVGVSLETARAHLGELGFTPAVIEVATAEASASRVFAQSPEAGEPLREGAIVTLVVSSGSP
jgi:transcriptional regulator with XRE-family HTH domain